MNQQIVAQFRSPCGRMIYVLMVLGLMLGLLQCSQGESPPPSDANTPNTPSNAPVQTRQPLKDVYIFLDNSLTIVSRDERRPSKKLAGMLRSLLGQSGGFLQPGDRVSIFPFDTSIDYKTSEEEVPGSDYQKINEVLEFFESERDGSTKTNLPAAFEKIETLCANTQDRLKIFVIASDFVNDPRNMITNRHEKNILDAERSIDRLYDACGPYFAGERQTNFLILLNVRGLVGINDDSDIQEQLNQAQNDDASINAAIMREIRQKQQILAKENSAKVIAYLKKKMNAIQGDQVDVNEFKKVFQRAVTKWLSLTHLSLVKNDDYYPGVKVQVRNTNWFPVELNAISMTNYLDNPWIIADGSKQKDLAPGEVIELNLKSNQDFGYLPQSGGQLYLRPSQDPSPYSEQHQPYKVSIKQDRLRGIKNESLARLPGKKPMIRATVMVEVEGEVGERVELEVHLKRVGTTTLIRANEPEAHIISSKQDTFEITSYFDVPTGTNISESKYRVIINEQGQDLSLESVEKDVPSRFRSPHFLFGAVAPILLFLALLYLAFKDGSPNFVWLAVYLTTAGLAFVLNGIGILNLEPYEDWAAALPATLLTFFLAMNLFIKNHKQKIANFIAHPQQVPMHEFAMRYFAFRTIGSLCISGLVLAIAFMFLK